MPTISQPNAALKHLYCRNWAALREIMSRFQGLSAPYLAWVHPDYERADVRLVVVGKETNGWQDCKEIEPLSTDAAVKRLMEGYRDFELGMNYSGKQAFWTPVHELYHRLNPNGMTFGFVALNASKMDQDQTQPNDEARDAIVATGLLRDEIRILDPHVVVATRGHRTSEAQLPLLSPAIPELGVATRGSVR